MCGSLAMSLRISLVSKLLWNEGITYLLGELLCPANSSRHTLVGRGQLQSCTKSLQQFAALYGHSVGHGEDNPVAT